MAKKGTKTTVRSGSAKSTNEASIDKQLQVGEVVARHRAALNEELKRIDPTLIMELAVGPAIDRLADLPATFSDWPDTWNDGGRWVKSWGKGGDEAMLPLDTLRERMQIARIKGLLKPPSKKSDK